MQITSDGRVFVYGLFGADGCECVNLEGLFSTENAANARKAELQATAETLGVELGRPFKVSRECYGDPDLLTVKMLEVFNAQALSDTSGEGQTFYVECDGCGVEATAVPDSICSACGKERMVPRDIDPQ